MSKKLTKCAKIVQEIKQLLGEPDQEELDRQVVKAEAVAAYALKLQRDGKPFMSISPEGWVNYGDGRRERVPGL